MFSRFLFAIQKVQSFVHSIQWWFEMDKHLFFHKIWVVCSLKRNQLNEPNNTKKTYLAKLDKDKYDTYDKSITHDKQYNLQQLIKQLAWRNNTNWK